MEFEMYFKGRLGNRAKKQMKVKKIGKVLA